VVSQVPGARLALRDLERVVAGRAVGELEDAHVGVALRAQGLRAARLAADAHGHLLGPDLGGLGPLCRRVEAQRAGRDGLVRVRTLGQRKRNRAGWSCHCQGQKPITGQWPER